MLCDLHKLHSFDFVSHKYLDRALKKAGASRKTRAIFRAIYRAAAGTARVNGVDGEKVYSKIFEVRRGVIQVDIISLFFSSLILINCFMNMTSTEQE